MQIYKFIVLSLIKKESIQVIILFTSVNALVSVGLCHLWFNFHNTIAFNLYYFYVFLIVAYTCMNSLCLIMIYQQRRTSKKKNNHHQKNQH